MDKEKKNEARRTWWMQFLISVLGTAIGVGLTFAGSKMVETHKKEQDQRLTAMMVIHDIDVTIDQLKTMNEQDETLYNLALFVTEHIDHLDSLSLDTLYQVLEYILSDAQDLRFNTSIEKVYHSSQDSWKNLESMKFLDNVQSFYFDRQSLQEIWNSSDVFEPPVPLHEYNRIFVENGILTNDDYHILLAKFMKEKLMDKNVQYYIYNSPRRTMQLKNVIDSWTTMNDENKFLMSITDEELNNYVNHISKNGKVITEKELVGEWTQSIVEGDSIEFVFKKDHTFTYVDISSEAVQHPDFQGNVNFRMTGCGTWSIKGDSLIRLYNPDSFDTEIDPSHVTVQPGKRQSLDKYLKEWKQNYQEACKQYEENNRRISRAARLDASRNKMEWKGSYTDEKGAKQDLTVYLKRKK